MTHATNRYSLRILVVTLLAFLIPLVSQAQSPEVEENFADQVEQAISASSELALIGKTPEQAMESLGTVNIPFRVVEEDGEPLMVTEDYRPGRINATLDSGLITSYTIEATDITITNNNAADITTDVVLDGETPATVVDTATTALEEVINEVQSSWWQKLLDFLFFWR